MTEIGRPEPPRRGIWLLPPAPTAPDADRPSLQSILDGFRCVRKKKVLLGIFVVDTNAMIFGMPRSLYPAAARRMKLGREFFARSVHEVAPDLVGATLLVDSIGGTIVEVEAYDHEDPAAHGYRGKTARNASMFGPSGHAYVYRSYGIHWCLNFVCEEEGSASAVLIRALEPTAGLDAMRERRGLENPRLLCAGPGRLTQALAVTREHDGLPLDRPPFEVHARARETEVVAGSRVGITQAADRLWRYGLAGSRFLSRPLPGRRRA